MTRMKTTCRRCDALCTCATWASTLYTPSTSPSSRFAARTICAWTKVVLCVWSSCRKTRSPDEARGGETRLRSKRATQEARARGCAARPRRPPGRWARSVSRPGVGRRLRSCARVARRRGAKRERRKKGAATFSSGRAKKGLIRAGPARAARGRAARFWARGSCDREPPDPEVRRSCRRCVSDARSGWHLARVGCFCCISLPCTSSLKKRDRLFSFMAENDETTLGVVPFVSQRALNSAFSSPPKKSSSLHTLFSSLLLTPCSRRAWRRARCRSPAAARASPGWRRTASGCPRR